MTPAPFVLASASPRRSALLRERGVDFEVVVSHADEDLPEPMAPAQAAMFLAGLKAQAVASRLAAPDRPVLGADTIVALGPDEAAQLLGKPATPAEAADMLRALSATRHRVITGIAVHWGERAWQDFECTWVHMRPIREAEVQAYVASGEWRDKAGGYAIQESADAFVERLEGGGFDNVVGLPVERSLALLQRAGWRV